MTSPLSGRPEPEAPESAVDARRRLADAQASSASQAAASAAALAQAQHDVAVSLRHAGPLTVGTINGAQAAPPEVHTLTHEDVVAAEQWDTPVLRQLIEQLHRAVVNVTADKLGVTPLWHTADGPKVTDARWAEEGTSEEGWNVVGTISQPPFRKPGQPDPGPTHYVITTEVKVQQL